MPQVCAVTRRELTGSSAERPALPNCSLLALPAPCACPCGRFLTDILSDVFASIAAALEIFSQDLGSASGEMQLLGSVQTTERFHRLAWGVGGVDSGSLPMGMLAGGLVDGTVKVYNPSAMVKCVCRSGGRRRRRQQQQREQQQQCEQQQQQQRQRLRLRFVALSCFVLLFLLLLLLLLLLLFLSCRSPLR